MTANPQTYRLARWGYYLGLVVAFVAIGFVFGPRWILFRKFTRPAPDDFIPEITRNCVPAIQAIKRYQLADGHLPERLEDLAPDFVPADSRTYFRNQEFVYMATTLGQVHMITYTIGVPDEHWEVSGAFVRGRVSLGPVIVPTTNPVRHP